MEFENLEEKFRIDDLRRVECICQPIVHIKKANYLSTLTFIRDDLIKDNLRDKLVEQTRHLEEKQDWHPGSNKQVLDLLHPSMYFYVDGITVLTSQEEKKEPGTKEPDTKEPDTKEPEQCLICNEDKVTVTLTCRHGFCKTCILHWSQNSKTCPCCRAEFDLSIINRSRPQPGFLQWLPANFTVTRDESEEEDEKDEDELYRDETIKVEFTSYINNLTTDLLDPIYLTFGKILSEFIPEFEEVFQAVAAKELGVIGHKELTSGQVIVKLANIVLTPQSPEYPGGNWHLEGIPDERIVATGIYYYDFENVTQSELKFRMNINHSEINYPQGMFKTVDAHYGLERDSENVSNQFHLGSIYPQEGQCLVFPNCLQHRLSPFSLKDRSKPGHRKILVFFLIHPDYQIISTRDVAPQQDKISLEEAKMYRELLMFHRSHELKNQDTFYKREIMLCEH